MKANLSDRQMNWLCAVIGLVCSALLLTLEILTDNDELTLTDILVDALGIFLTIGAAVGVAVATIRLQAQREEKLTLLRDLEIARAEGNDWRRKVQLHLASLKAGMDIQFHEWGMTSAEREVGLLMLKGLSHKEIAVLRATTEATVRQQAQAIYRKANLPGKMAFSAYFLQDLFAPEKVTEGVAAASSGNGSGESASAHDLRFS